MWKRLSLLLLLMTQAISALEKKNYFIQLDQIHLYQLQRISNANKSDLLLSQRSELPKSNQRKLQNFYNSQKEIQVLVNSQNGVSTHWDNNKHLFLSNFQEASCLNTNCSQIEIKTPAGKTINTSSKNFVKKVRRNNDLIIMFHTLAFITLLVIIFVFNVYYCGSILYYVDKEKFKLINN